jgi:predicted enzyme involved in methoxymalonyl-ACP biosynthesis
MSCRVFGREVEEAFFGAICKRAEDLGIKEMSIAFKESAKNMPAKEFVMKHFGGGDKFIKVKSIVPKWIKIIYGKV